MAASSLDTNLSRFFRTPRQQIYTAALVVSLVRYVLIWTLFPQFAPGERFFFSILSFFLISLLWEGIHAFNQYLNQILPFETGPLRRFLIQTGCCLAVTFAGHTWLAIQFERYYSDYFPPDIARAIKVASYFLDILIVLAVNTAYFGFYFFDKWKKNLVEKETWEKERALLQKERITAQYDNLINQLNPHFLFNSLSSLDSLIDDNPVLARQFLQQLSKVYRYVLQHKDKELVTLATELAFIQNYVSLLQTRFDSAFQLQCQVDTAALDKKIVPVTLQVLIENAIKHNVISEAQPLVVTLTTHGGYLAISNVNRRKKNIGTSNQQGLVHLRQLYSFLSEQDVRITNKESFTVQVPLLS